MKFEIDLNDLLGDEYGSETLKESIQRQVISALKADVSRGIKEKIDVEVQKVIQDEVATQVKAIAPNLLNGLIDLEYQPVTSWGSPEGKPTTMRQQFIKTLQNEFQYKKTNYSSDRNAFTRAVDETVEKQVSDFKKEYNKKIDETFITDAYNYALKKLNERLKV